MRCEQRLRESEGLGAHKAACAVAFVCCMWTTAGVAAETQHRTALSGIVPPQPITAPPANYPPGGKGNAEVRLIVEVGRKGNVRAAEVDSGEEPFASAALEAVNAWRFSPATRNGAPVPARVRVEIRFDPPTQAPQPLPATGDGNAPQEIVARGRRNEIGITVIPVEDARRIPGSFGDPLKVAEVQPGVATVTSALPYYFVRGAPPGNVGYYYEGIRVPLLFHVGPAAPVINPAMVGGVDLLASAYPVRYGRHAGALVVSHAAAPKAMSRGEIQLRAFDASGYLEGPVGETVTLGVGGRHDYIGPILERVSPQYDLSYWDYQSRLQVELDDRNSVSVMAFGASDDLYNIEEDLKLFEAEFHRISLQWNRQTPSSSISLAADVGQDHVATTVERIETSEGPESSSSASLRSRGANIRFNASYFATPAVTVRGGVDYRLDRIEDEEVTNSVGETSLAATRTDYSAGTYLDLILRMADNFEVVPGLRLETGLWREASYLYLEPRLAWKVGLFSGVHWTSSMGIINQLPTVAVRAPAIPLSALERDVQRAWQTSQDIDFVLPGDLQGRVSGFYTRLEAANSDIQTDTYGGEVFLRRDLSERIGFVASYTLSKNTVTVDGVSRPSEFDRRHVVTASVGADLGAGVRLGVRGYFMSGQRYETSCPDPACSPAPDGTATRYRVSGRLPDFWRADFRLDKRFELGSGTWLTIAAEWFNATLSNEVYDATWVPSTGLTQTAQDALTLPSLNVEAGF